MAELCARVGRSHANTAEYAERTPGLLRHVYPVAVLGVMLLTPGAAALMATGAWRDFSPLARGAMALLLSVAFYPLLFYFAWWAGVSVTVPALALALVAGTAFVAVRIAATPRTRWRLDALEWCALAVLALTVCTRAVIAYEYPFPAWADSLHHALITQATAARGGLPDSLEPVMPIQLAQYHRGLYGISGAFSMLAGIHAHTAVLWIGLLANALAGAGAYVLLDRWSGRFGAVAALVCLGLVWDQPADYVNLGRAPHLVANLLLLGSWAALLRAMPFWSRPVTPPGRRRRAIFHTAAAAVLAGAVFLVHFRAALFLALLVLPTLAWGFWRVRTSRPRAARWVGSAAAWALGATVVASPAIPDVLRIHLLPRAVQLQQAFDRGTLAISSNDYQYAALVTWEQLARWQPLWWAMALGTMVLLLKRRRIASAMLTWLAASAGAFACQSLRGELDLVNPGFALLMLYMPAGVLLGAGANAAAGWTRRARRPAAVLLLFAAVLAVPRTLEVVEPFRHFMTRADLPAMGWIRKHVPASAVFAVNTTFWVPGIPHGTDGGYWIPYFTGRATTAGCLLPGRFASNALVSSKVVALQNGEDVVGDLRRLGVTHVYVGARGNYAHRGLDTSRLRAHPALHLVFSNTAATIFEIRSPAWAELQPDCGTGCSGAHQ